MNTLLNLIALHVEVHTVHCIILHVYVHHPRVVRVVSNNDETQSLDGRLKLLEILQETGSQVPRSGDRRFARLGLESFNMMGYWHIVGMRVTKRTDTITIPKTVYLLVCIRDYDVGLDSDLSGRVFRIRYLRGCCTYHSTITRQNYAHRYEHGNNYSKRPKGGYELVRLSSSNSGYLF